MIIESIKLNNELINIKNIGFEDNTLNVNLISVNVNSKKLFFIFIFLLFIYYTLFVFPTFDDFLPGIVKVIKEVKIDGYIPFENNVFLFYILGSILSIILDYNSIIVSVLPILLLQTIYVLYAIILKILSQRKYPELFLVIIVLSGYIGIFNFGFHSLGLVFLLNFFLIYLKQESFSLNEIILLSIFLISIPLTSYKINFVLFFFLFFVYILKFKTEKSRLNLLIILIIITSSLKYFIFTTIVGVIRDIQNFTEIDVVNKLLTNSSDLVLNNLLLKSTFFVRGLNTLFLLMIISIFIIVFGTLVTDVKLRRHNHNFALFSLFASGVIVFILYYIIGRIELSIVIISLLLYLVFYIQNCHNKNKYIYTLMIIFLFVLLISVPIKSISHTHGQQDYSFFENTGSVNPWVDDFVTVPLYTDVYSYSIIKYYSNDSQESEVMILNTTQVKYLFIYSNSDILILLNQEADYITLEGWIYLIGWNQNNEHIFINNEIIYNSNYNQIVLS